MLTVVVTRYAETDDIVERCLRSLSRQKKADVTVLFLDQQKSANVKQLCKELSNAPVTLIYKNIAAKSLSYARNYGLQKSTTDNVVFCDVDCTLPSNWTAEIAKTFKKTDAAIVGTKIVPHWVQQPNWYHKSKYILEFYSMLNIAEKRIKISKVVGASFAIDKKKLRKEAYFDEKLGRKKGKLLGGEETDLCMRAQKQGHSIFYTPHTYANHWVEPERMELRWLWKRAFYGGVSRATRGGNVQAFNSKPSLIDFCALALIILPYLLGFFVAKLKQTSTA